MNIKQLLLISAIGTFSAQAMEEIKVGAEQEDGKEVQEYRASQKYSEINQSCPSSIKFLIKVLDQKGIPETLIYKIIDEHLKVYLVGYVSLTNRRNFRFMVSTFEDMLKDRMIFNGVDRTKDIDQIHIEHTSYEPLKFNVLFRIEVTPHHFESCQRPFWVMNRPTLSIDTHKPEKLSQKISSWIKDNKLKSLATASAAVGALWYLVKKIRK